MASSIPRNISGQARTFTGPLSKLERPMNAPAAALRFPIELEEIDHFVTMTAYETEQITRRGATMEKVNGIIHLPLPGNLSTAYNIQYTDPEFAGIGHTILEAFGSGMTTQERDTFNAGLGNAGAGAIAGAVFGGIFGGNIATGAALGAAGAILSGQNSRDSGLQTGAIASVLNSTAAFGAGIVAQQGFAVNPHKVLMFQNVGFRSHQFNYQFSPKSFEEATMLRDIIKAFKMFASPSYPGQGESINIGSGVRGMHEERLDLSAGKHFFKYPEFFTIKFNHPNYLFGIGPSVIESFSVDYHPVGMPTYNRENDQDPTPTQINISISFRETEIITKDLIRDDNR